VSSGRRDLPSHPGESAADEARQALGLGLDAPVSVLDAVEDLGGVPVCVQEFAGDVAGLFYRRDGRAYLFVNGGHPVARQRFTLAHEFGHERMGHSPRVESPAAMGSKDPQEVQANYFAGAFLAPRQAVRNWSERHELPADLELVVRMGAFFGLSAEASRIRLELAGVIAKTESARLKARIAASEHRGLLERLGLTGYEDALSRLARDIQDGRRALPRLPAMLVHGAREAGAEGLVDEQDMLVLLRGTPTGPSGGDEPAP
jgi:Zn-dependent peptidase ImmA (M78 family)